MLRSVKLGRVDVLLGRDVNVEVFELFGDTVAH